VTLHAIGRFADRVLGLDTVLGGLDNREAPEAVRGFGYPVDDIEASLAFYGYPGSRYGAAGVTVRRVGLVLSGNHVVTVIMRGH